VLRARNAHDSEHGAPAQLLNTGDGREVLALERHGNTAIITVKEMLSLLGFRK
jgi:hypothetical protein